MTLVLGWDVIVASWSEAWIILIKFLERENRISNWDLEVDRSLRLRRGEELWLGCDNGRDVEKLEDLRRGSRRDCALLTVLFEMFGLWVIVEGWLKDLWSLGIGLKLGFFRGQWDELRDCG